MFASWHPEFMFWREPARSIIDRAEADFDFVACTSVAKSVDPQLGQKVR